MLRQLPACADSIHRAFYGGGRLQWLVSLIDLPPTLPDAASIPVPDAMEGHSIISAINKVIRPDDVFVQISESQVRRAIRSARWKYSVSALDKQGRNDSASDTHTEEFLYDLEADPYELTKFDRIR